MATEAVWRFATESIQDPEISRRLDAATDGKDEQQAAEAVVAYGADLGYEFTAEEVLKVRAEIRSRITTEEELEDEALAGVTGGTVMGALYNVFKKSVAQQRKDAQYWLGKVG